MLLLDYNKKKNSNPSVFHVKKICTISKAQCFQQCGDLKTFVLKTVTYEKTIFTPPLRPLVNVPFPLPPAKTCAFITTSFDPRRKILFITQKVGNHVQDNILLNTHTNRCY